jgi:hypothetical protein
MCRRGRVGAGGAGRSDGVRSLGVWRRLEWEEGGGLDLGGLGVAPSSERRRGQKRKRRGERRLLYLYVYDH